VKGLAGEQFTSKRKNLFAIEVNMKLLITLLFALLASQAYAQQACSLPAQQITVFFANGIDTDRESAEASKGRLQQYLGETYEGQTLTYDLAYNNTTNFVVDLLQSTAQAGIQFDSQILAWLYGLGLAPDWFNQWYQTFLKLETQIVAQDLADHVAQYQQALVQGKKVMVVSHSQGNFYVNDAKKALEAQQPPLPMTAFGIFGVATPANNVGGAAQPYYTNNRDVILAVPGSLPANWTLKDAAGSAVGIINPVVAHSFTNTYMSDDYDIKPSLVLGIKQRMSALTTPNKPVACNDYYRKHFISLVAGNYTGDCGNPQLEQFVIAPGGTFSAAGKSLDVSGIEAQLNLTQSFNVNGISIVGGYDEQANGTPASGATAEWLSDGLFKGGGVSPSLPSALCFTTSTKLQVPPTYLPSKLDITQDVATLLAGYRRLFPKGTCAAIATNGVVTSLNSLPVYMSGTAINYGDASVDLLANRFQEEIFVLPGHRAKGNSPDYEPQFSYILTFQGNRRIQLLYKLDSGLTEFSVWRGPIDAELICTMP
jgi:hypothetical protein